MRPRAFAAVSVARVRADEVEPARDREGLFDEALWGIRAREIAAERVGARAQFRRSSRQGVLVDVGEDDDGAARL
jgi:hypothetical protein